jgi:hypothetical protein
MRTHAPQPGAALAKLWIGLALGSIALCFVAISMASRRVPSCPLGSALTLTAKMQHREAAKPSPEDMLNEVARIMKRVDRQLGLNATQTYWYDFLRVSAHLSSPRLARYVPRARQARQLLFTRRHG